MRLPKSLLFFAASVTVFLLQVFPYPGIFLMMLAAPFWSVLLVNGGFVGIGFEVCTGRVSRYWLILPLTWFGTYAGFAAVDQGTVWQLQHDIAEANAAVQISFDPTRQALVTIGSYDGDWLVTNYALPVIYSRKGKSEVANHLATRVIDKATCRRVDDRSFVEAGVYTFGVNLLTENDPPLCMIRWPEDPAVPELTVSIDEHETMIKRLPIRKGFITVTTPDGTHHVLLDGFAAPLPWFPRPVMGCALSSGSPAWQCDAGFMRDGFTPLQVTETRYHSDAVALAHALGLAVATSADRRGADPGQVIAAAEAVRQRVVAFETAQLDRVLEDPSADVGSLPFRSLRGRQDIIQPRLDRIVVATERGIEAGGRSYRTYSNAQQLFGLVTQLPADVIEPYRAWIDKLKHKDKSL